jgi:hypothetical protein
MTVYKVILISTQFSFHTFPRFHNNRHVIIFNAYQLISAMLESKSTNSKGIKFVSAMLINTANVNV